MTYLASDTPWHSTDEGAAVPVRSAHTQPAVQFTETPELPKRTAYVRIDPPRSSAGLAAVTGISVVMVLGTVFYLGIDNLRSSLLNQGKNVTITAQGTFDPAAITIARGETLTITNENSDPQVLKTQGTELFPSTMLFKDQQPLSFTVPTSAAVQQYVYYSETLSADKTLTITVTATAGGAGTSASMQSAGDIPIPPDVQSIRSPSSTQNTASTPAASTVDTMNASHTTAVPPSAAVTTDTSAPTLQIGNETHAAAPASSSASSETPIPVNPYTVGRQGLLGIGTTKVQSSSSNLHSGAPLNQYATPKTTTSSGPQLVWTVIAALALFVVVSRRMLKSA